jgi:hypothetical protein
MIGEFGQWCGLPRLVVGKFDRRLHRYTHLGDDWIKLSGSRTELMAVSLDELIANSELLGLAYRGAFHPAPEESVPTLADGTPALTIVLLGWTGSVQWPVFAASPEADDGRPDPLNRWSKRLIDGMAMELGAAAFYPFGGPPWLDFQRWALRAEPIHHSPLGLLIHPQWGLWHSYRGALGLRERLELPHWERVAHPCESCREHPCLSACPVSAFALDHAYDVAACHNYLNEGTAECLTQACAARRACPVASEMRYVETQAAFHMRAFLGNRLG